METNLIWLNFYFRVVAPYNTWHPLQFLKGDKLWLIHSDLSHCSFYYACSSLQYARNVNLDSDLFHKEVFPFLTLNRLRHLKSMGTVLATFSRIPQPCLPFKDNKTNGGLPDSAYICLFYGVFDVINNYIFKKKIDVNLRVSPAMFIGARDVIDSILSSFFTEHRWFYTQVPAGTRSCLI